MVDFGFSRLLGTDLSIPDSLGYPLMLSPEQLPLTKNISEMINKDAKHQKCEVWALGVLLYFLLTGMFPFSGFHEKFFGELDGQEEPGYEDIE